MRVRHSDGYIEDSLWSHSKAFRVLVYVTACLGVLIAIGFFIVIKNQRAMNASQTSSAQVSLPLNSGGATSASLNSTPVTPLPKADQPPSINDLPLAKNTWRSTLNPAKQIPSTGFDAYYVNTNNPAVVVHKENVPNIEIDYSYSDFHNIPSESFGAYWIGRIKVPEDGMYELYKRISWANARVMIDGRILTESKDSLKEAPIFLKKGEYVLEVEFANEWHSTNFILALMPVVRTYNSSNIGKALSELNLPAHVSLYSASTHKTTNKDGTFNVHLDTAGEPMVLYLHSDRTVHWQVYGQTIPRAIVYTGDTSTVSSVGSPPIFKMEDVLIGHEFFSNVNNKPECECQSGNFRCKGGFGDANTDKTLENIKNIMGLNLSGGSGVHSATHLVVPETYVNQQFILDAYARSQEVEHLRRACTLAGSNANNVSHPPSHY
ncbi:MULTISPECIES: hypothetical protein [Moraxella]|uniref:PA14 domain-containing protein n=1 Tax=Moraxella lacunata TaxID=477 RepID=A0A1B8PVV0_MORLA|nr:MULTISPECIES: hypothetical protein [Moraxella]MBE9579706.1 hypothetical protein [Moraxella sp. K1664]MBE9589017.1 hypothetical protein [Moraxella sp. K1630]MBE9597285.1 hypothetical protein [Moraxella sp. K2450]MDH9219760.1 hypothetical protein [Moraxella lacunata]MDI4483016.1 hypothetical protein [Moraxella lacunata]